MAGVVNAFQCPCRQRKAGSLRVKGGRLKRPRSSNEMIWSGRIGLRRRRKLGRQMTMLDDKWPKNLAQKTGRTRCV
jgi:hypothetical protein